MIVSYQSEQTAEWTELHHRSEQELINTCDAYFLSLRRNQACMCRCDYTYRHLLLIQMCSDQAPRHGSTAQGKMHPTQLRAALQNSLTAGLCQCKNMCVDLLFIQVCSDPTQALLRAALQNRLTAGLCQCRNTCEDLLFIQVRSDLTPRPAALILAKCIPQCPVLLCKTGSHQALCHCKCIHEDCCSYRCAVTQHQGSAALLERRQAANSKQAAAACVAAMQHLSHLMP